MDGGCEAKKEAAEEGEAVKIAHNQFYCDGYKKLTIYTKQLSIKQTECKFKILKMFEIDVRYFRHLHLIFEN